jgi:tRNA-splicing ligase RtcB
MWLAHPLPPDVKLAIDRLARTDDAQHVAVMPDVHLAREVCVGTVLATSRLIYPDAVGGDIGCGMAAISFDVSADVLSDENAAAKLLTGLARCVPTNRHATRKGRELPNMLNEMPLSDRRLDVICRRDGVIQFGTLGRGNHFLEFQSDDEGRLWLMVHSGSRAVGPAIRDLYGSQAAQSSTGLRFLDAKSREGMSYLSDVQWAQAYARESRRTMIHAAAELASKLFRARMDESSFVNCDHNHVRQEIHEGQTLWVHRKGAMLAGAGVAGILPGSMGTESYHVEGRGCAVALCSSAHGAGRAMSRDQARRKISTRDLARQMCGVWFDHRISHALCEESPSAYKDIRAVLRAQHELVRVVRRLRPVLIYKS